MLTGQDLTSTDRPGKGVEEQAAQIRRIVKVEHIEDRPGELIERVRSERLPRRQSCAIDKAEVPVDLDKPQARGLVGYGVEGAKTAWIEARIGWERVEVFTSGFVPDLASDHLPRQPQRKWSDRPT